MANKEKLLKMLGEKKALKDEVDEGKEAIKEETEIAEEPKKKEEAKATEETKVKEEEKSEVIAINPLADEGFYRSQLLARLDILINLLQKND